MQSKKLTPHGDPYDVEVSFNMKLSSKEKEKLSKSKKSHEEAKLEKKDEKDKDHWLKQLEKFPLDSLQKTQKGEFDMRRRESQPYLDLCKKAGVDPDKYYCDFQKNKKEKEKLVYTQKDELDMRHKVNKEYVEKKKEEKKGELAKIAPNILKAVDHRLLNQDLEKEIKKKK